MNDNVPIDIGGSVRMDGGPTIRAFIPRAGVVRINVLGGSHPRLGRAGSPPAHLPPPAPRPRRRSLSRSLFFIFFFAANVSCWTRGCEALYAAMCACRCLQQLPTPLVIAEHVIGHRPMKHSANAERRH